MNSEDRDLLIQVSERVKFIQRDLAELKSEMKSHRRSIGTLKRKVWMVTGGLYAVQILFTFAIKLKII